MKGGSVGLEAGEKGMVKRGTSGGIIFGISGAKYRGNTCGF